MTYRARALAKGITIAARLLTGVGIQQAARDLPYSDPAIYFANHTSHLDAVVLWSALPADLRARTRPVAAKDYWTGGRVRRYVATQVMETVLVDRGGPTRTPAPAPVPAKVATGAGGSDGEGAGTALRGEEPPRALSAVDEMVTAVRDGCSLIFFPEGTRRQRRVEDEQEHESPQIAKFRSGIYHLAAELPETDLVPVHLENLNRILPKGEVLPVPLMGRVRFGAPLRIVPGEKKPQFLERTRAALLELRGDAG